jgi:hypothetical protein
MLHPIYMRRSSRQVIQKPILERKFVTGVKWADTKLALGVCVHTVFTGDNVGVVAVGAVDSVVDVVWADCDVQLIDLFLDTICVFHFRSME